MVELGERLNSAMKARGVSITALSLAVGMSYQGIRKIVRQETKEMAASNCDKISAFLKINSKWLSTGEGQMDLVSEGIPPPPAMPDEAIAIASSRTTRIPVIGKGAGGLPERIWDDAGHPVGESDRFGMVYSSDPHAFLVEVSEESMLPKYTPGDFALVEPSSEAELEDDVLVRLATGQTMIKRLLSQRGAYRFGSYNNTAVLHYRFEDVTWVYYVPYPVPRRKIKDHW